MAARAGTTSAVPDKSTNQSSADLISGQFLFYHDHNFSKSKENLRFLRLVPLFVPITVCVTTNDDGTAIDVTIGMWRHNQRHEPRAQWRTLAFTPKVAKPCNLQVMICHWANHITKICISDAMNLKEITHCINLKATKISRQCVFGLVMWPWRLLEKWLEACNSLTVVGAGTMHGFGTGPIRNPTIWLVESRNQIN